MTKISDCLRDFLKWSELSKKMIEEAAEELLRYAGPGFEWSGVATTSSGVCVASLRHQYTGMEFRLIPGGRDYLGLSDSEFEAVKCMPNADIDILGSLRPSENIEISPFLISRLPLLEETVRQFIEIDWTLFRPDFRPLVGEETGKIPIYLSRSEVKAVLSHLGFSLPTEAQWEFALRGGTNSPFYFGEAIPGTRELESIFVTDFRDTSGVTENTFGIAGMLVGGWCRDTFSTQRWHGTDFGPPYVIRGGAAIYWPWQNTGEWMLALSAMRRSSLELEDETCSAHAVLPVNCAGPN